jgi:hypothetical protein
VLERKLRLVVNEAARHHQVARDPLRAFWFESLDFVFGGAVQLLARDIVVNLGRTLTVGTVGTAEIAGVGYPGRPVLGPIAPEIAGP